MKLLTGILAIIWFVGWGFWFLYERGHLEFSAPTVEEATIEDIHPDTIVEPIIQPIVQEVQRSFLLNHPPLDSVDIIIDSLMAQRTSEETVHVTSYFSELEPYSGSLGNLGIERSEKLIQNARKRYAGRVLQPIGLKLKSDLDTTGIHQYYSVEKINKNSPIKIINDERVLIFFPYGSNNEWNTPKITMTLDSLTSIWKSSGNRLIISGNTDNSSSESTNYNLGMDRAKAVQEKIVSLGFPAEKIITLSRGEKEPISTNTTSDGRYLNRRVEILLDK